MEKETTIIREYVWAEPDNMRMLVEHFRSAKRVSDLLGISPGTISSDIKAGKTKKVCEIACSKLLDDIDLLGKTIREVIIGDK